MTINKKPLEEERRLFRECINIQEKNNEFEVADYARHMINAIISRPSKECMS